MSKENIRSLQLADKVQYPNQDRIIEEKNPIKDQTKSRRVTKEYKQRSWLNDLLFF
jgi:hypothetical protein